jgi:macrolide-specific efflux system membrane fusion protein
MTIRLAALLLASALPALGAATGTVRRGDLIVRVKVTGTVVTDDVFRLKSTIEGRVENVNVSSGSWRGAGENLAQLANKELAAMIDAKGTQDQDHLEDRWSTVFQPTPVRCPVSCYVLKVFAKAHSWVKPQAVLLEAASKLKLIGRVRPEDAPLLRDGMILTFWAVKDPKRKLTGRITRLILDIQGERVEPGATFTLDLTPDRYFDPGTDWEGEIIPLRKSNVLIVPTAALIVNDGVAYLPIRVSTGTTTPELTEITAGIDENHQILILDDSELHGTVRHKQTIDSATFEPHRYEQRAAPPEKPAATGLPAVPAAGTDEKAPPEKQPATLDDKSYGGEDPYGQ